MWHVIEPLVTAVFGLSCFVGGGVTALVVCKLVQRGRRPRNVALPRLDPKLDEFFADRARDWANQRGTPPLSGFAHSRLRLAHYLAQRTRQRYYDQ